MPFNLEVYNSKINNLLVQNVLNFKFFYLLSMTTTRATITTKAMKARTRPMVGPISDESRKKNPTEGSSSEIRVFVLSKIKQLSHITCNNYAKSSLPTECKVCYFHSRPLHILENKFRTHLAVRNTFVLIAFIIVNCQLNYGT